MEKTQNKNKSKQNHLIKEHNEREYAENDIFATIRVMNGEQVLKKKVITRKSKIPCDMNYEK